MSANLPDVARHVTRARSATVIYENSNFHRSNAMAYQLGNLQDDTTLVTQSDFQNQIQKLLASDGSRYRRLWAYYRNPMRTCGVPAEEQGSERPYRQGQEWGLPSRITGLRSGLEIFSGSPVEGVARKEVVIENDIGWRIDTMVDYLFGKPIVINSAAPDPQRGALIEQLLRQIIAHNGGIVFLQQLALLGAVYGYIDVLVKFDAAGLGESKSEADGLRVEDRGSKVEKKGLDNRADSRSSTFDSRSSTLDSSRDSRSSTLDSRSSAADAPACGTSDLGQPPSKQHDPSPDGDPPSTTQRAARAGAAHVSTAGPESGIDDAESSGASRSSREALSCLARRIRLEIVEPTRALPLLCPTDFRQVRAYAQVYQVPQRTTDSSRAAASNRAADAGLPKGSLIERLRSRFMPSSLFSARPADQTLVVEVITPDRWQRYEDEILVAEGANSLGRVPLVHIQNSAMPFEYAGASDVEPLIPIQDEINARQSDRAYRITMQSFKMYLGKGIENFMQMPVAPGRMWLTDNENAEITEFGGDGKTFSEDNHISQIREAMDKISGVTPIAAGAIKSRIGRLTSAAALRVTMLALLAKTERKRTAYGPAIEQMCEMALDWLDRAGLFPSTPQERAVEIHWPSPIPVNELERIQEAQAKVQLGVSQETVLRELGY